MKLRDFEGKVVLLRRRGWDSIKTQTVLISEFETHGVVVFHFRGMCEYDWETDLEYNLTYEVSTEFVHWSQIHSMVLTAEEPPKFSKNDLKPQPAR